MLGQYPNVEHSGADEQRVCAPARLSVTMVCTASCCCPAVQVAWIAWQPEPCCRPMESPAQQLIWPSFSLLLLLYRPAVQLAWL
jgi:hypothetical protein